jgi:hypothetical protein
MEIKNPLHYSTLSGIQIIPNGPTINGKQGTLKSKKRTG